MAKCSVPENNKPHHLIVTKFVKSFFFFGTFPQKNYKHKNPILFFFERDIRNPIDKIMSCVSKVEFCLSGFFFWEKKKEFFWEKKKKELEAPSLKACTSNVLKKKG